METQPAANTEQQQQPNLMSRRLLDLVESSFVCSVCSELFIEPVILNCSHSYCKVCITRWRQERGTCPQCRTIISSVTPERGIQKIIEESIDLLSPEKKQSREVAIREREEAAAATTAASAQAKSFLSNVEDSLNNLVMYSNFVTFTESFMNLIEVVNSVEAVMLDPSRSHPQRSTNTSSRRSSSFHRYLRHS